MFLLDLLYTCTCIQNIRFDITVINAKYRIQSNRIIEHKTLLEKKLIWRNYCSSYNITYRIKSWTTAAILFYSLLYFWCECCLSCCISLLWHVITLCFPKCEGEGRTYQSPHQPPNKINRLKYNIQKAAQCKCTLLLSVFRFTQKM